MKRILFPTILILIFCFQLFGQEKVDCPTIKVIPPSTLTRPDRAMLFSVLIAGKFDNSKLEYKWTVSKGGISDGQGTVAIAVETTEKMEGLKVKATVEIKGLPDNCPNRFSNEGEIDRIPRIECRCIIDEYGKLKWLDEQSRLQNGLSVELTNDPTAKGYIIFYIERDSELTSLIARQKKILKFLESLNISPCRILMKIEKGGDYQTKIFVVPEGAELRDYLKGLWNNK